jgi:hypothetical protein
MFADKYELETWNGPSWATIRARQMAACGGGCRCGKSRDPVQKFTGSRVWLSCLRCLGTIKQLPDQIRH